MVHTRTVDTQVGEGLGRLPLYELIGGGEQTNEALDTSLLRHQPLVVGCTR